MPSPRPNTPTTTLLTHYPWTQTPLIVGAPMRLIALSEMAVRISLAGGLGFIGAGTDVSNLGHELELARGLLGCSEPNITSNSAGTADFPGYAGYASSATLPIGIGFITWGAPLSPSIALVRTYRPAAVWFFAPACTAQLVEWARETRAASPETRIWVQVGSVAQAVESVDAVQPDVLVVQGTDAGGHGLVRGAGVLSLVCEVGDVVGERYGAAASRAGGEGEREREGKGKGDGEGEGVYTGPLLIAAGGISESRGAAAALCAGACGIVLGTRLLASPEANISDGYRREILRASDGGQSTVRTKVYDTLRGTNWAETHNARGVVNQSFVDAERGMDWEENGKLYREEEGKGDEGWGVKGRMTTYAGSGVGLVKEVMPVEDIVREVREGVREVLERTREMLG